MNFKRQHIYYLFSKIFNDLKGIVSLFIVYGILKVSRSGVNSFFVYGLLIVTIITLIFAIISWSRTVYKIEENNIYSKSGVFVIKDITIPFNKVQTIDITSSALQKLLKVCTIQVETSGGSKGEKEFEATINLSEALEIKKSILNLSDVNRETTKEDKKHGDNYIISIKDILVAALTSTQITIGFSALFAGYTFLSDKIPETYKDVLVNTTDGIINKYIGQQIVYKIIFIVIILLILSLIISFLGMILKYYKFSLIRHGENIKIKHGLLTTKEVTIPINRILYISIKEGLVRKPFGLCEVKISSVGYGNESGEKAMLCPLIKKKEFFNLLKVILPELEVNYKINRVSKKSFSSYFLIPIIIELCICTGLSTAFKYGYLFFIVIMFSIYIQLLSYRENGLSYNERFLYLRVRHIALHTIIVPKKRVQSITEVTHYFSNKHKIKRVKVYVRDTLTIKEESIKGIDSDYVDKIINWYK